MILPGSARNRVREQLRRVEVFTLVQMLRLLCCSRRTAQRLLRTWQCCTSYNANASYYALPEVVQFDSQGIWACGDALFSRYGNLTDTLQALVENSPAGMTAAELQAAVKVSIHSLLPSMVRSGKLARTGARGTFVYFATDPTRGAQQQQTRHSRGLAREDLTDADAVAVLVAFIKEPTLRAEELAARVRARAPAAAPHAIRRFFAAHGLSTAKKGALHSLPSSCSDTTGSA